MQSSEFPITIEYFLSHYMGQRAEWDHGEVIHKTP